MIIFTETQVAQLGTLTADGAANFAEGYAYLHSVISSLTEAELLSMGSSPQEAQDSLYWLGRATEINSNDLDSQANQFIRDVTRYGLAWDGLPAGSIQFNSDEIGRAVIGGILGSNNMMPIEQIVGLDVQAAIEDGGQTVAGWGGAFYYWDAPYTIPATGIETTIGGYITSTQGELEKFVAVASMASFNAVAQSLANGVGSVDDVLSILESFWTIAATGVVSQLPGDIRLMIATEVRDLALGGSALFNVIDMSNAYAYRAAAPGLNGAEVDLVSGSVTGLVSHEEDFRFIGSTINRVVATEHGDWINVRDNGPDRATTVYGLGGDDVVDLHGGTVHAYGDGGADQVHIDGDWADFDITKVADEYTLSSRSGAARQYTLSGFESFVFNDGSLSVGELLNVAPVEISWAPGSGHVTENLAAGAVVGTVIGSDTNLGDRLAYSLVGGHIASFAIDPGTGLVTTLASLDYEAGPSVWISVKITDVAGASVTKQLTIGIDNVSPTITGAGTISGTAEDDTIWGSNGNDTINAGLGKDVVHGLGGNDTFTDVVANNGADVYDGGSGVDTVTYHGGQDITINLTTGEASGGFANGDTFISIENVRTWEGNDSITGDMYANALRGEGGHDKIWGMGGNDKLYGGGGGDTLYGGAGNDYLYGNSETNGDSSTNTAVFSGSVYGYDFALWASNNRWLSVSGQDGFDWTIDIDVFKFDDATLTRQQIEAAWL